MRAWAKDTARQLQPTSIWCRKCPFLTMVPVMAVSDLVAARRAICGPDPVGDIFKPTATGPGLVHFEDEDDVCGSREKVREK